MTSVDEQEPQIRAGCYCRISSDPNDKREGVTRQREDTATLCEVKGWLIADYYVDNDRSASSGKDRPEWDRLLTDIKAGKIDAIAAWDQDRGWRMMAELEDLRKFFQGVGRQVPLATTGQGDIDLYSPTGILAAQIKTAVSEHEIAMMRIRQKRAGRQRAEQGRPKWRQAFGYLPYTGRKEDDDGTRHPDPVTAPLVREGYAAVVAGASLKSVAEMWNDAGALGRAGKPWTEQLVGQFLRKPRNAALRDYGGEIVGKGTWEPLVSETLWKQVQVTMDGRPGGGRGKRRTARKRTLTGVLLCGECEGRMHGGQSGDGTAVYICSTCRKVAVRAHHVEPLAVRLIGGRLAKDDAVHLLRKKQHDPAEAQRLTDEKADLYRDLDNLARERGEGLMTGRQLQIASEIVQAKIDAIEAQERDVEMLRVFDGIPLGTPEAVAAVERLTPDRLRAVIGVLARGIKVRRIGKSGNTFNPDRLRVLWWEPEDAA